MSEWPEDAGLRRLHDWLTRRLWTRAEAADILAGVDPDEHRPGNRQPGLWPLLPGIRWPESHEGHLSLHAQLVKDIENNLDALWTHPARDRSPSSYLRWAREQTPPIVPPWRSAARSCQFCMAVVAAELPDTLAEAQRKKRMRQVERSGREIDKVVLPIIATQNANGFANVINSKREVVIARVARLIETEFRQLDADKVPGARTCERYAKERMAKYYPEIPTSARKPKTISAKVAT